MSDAPKMIYLMETPSHGDTDLLCSSLPDSKPIAAYLRHDLHTAAIKELVDELKDWRKYVDGHGLDTAETDRLIKKYGGE